MTPLRQRILDALVLRGKAERTQQSYIQAVARLAVHYKRSPHQLSAEQAWNSRATDSKLASTSKRLLRRSTCL